MKLTELHPLVGNPRRGQVGVIVESLRTNGQYRPIVVNKGTGTGRPWEVLAGNHTLLAARELEWDEMDVWVVDVGEVEAKRIVAADNRTADMGLYDNEALLELLASLPDLDGTGYTDTDLKAIEELLAGPPDLDDLLDEVGDPLLDDTHTVVRLVVDPETAAVWLAHRKNFDNDTAALRTFMGL
jgi:ParB-like chromosome segregation protein Spo0J